MVTEIRFLFQILHEEQIRAVSIARRRSEVFSQIRFIQIKKEARNKNGMPQTTAFLRDQIKILKVL